MMKKLLILVTVLIALTQVKLNAQIDTEFWFAAPDVTAGGSGPFRDRPIFLVISTLDEPAAVVILQPADLSFAPILENIPPNSTRQINLTNFLDRIETRPVNTIRTTGLLIRSSAPITAYYEVRSPNNTDIMTLKGKNANGTLFFTPFQTLWRNDNGEGGSEGLYNPPPRSGFIVMATDDTTDVTITPTNDFVGHPAGVPFTISLHRGQTYYCEAAGFSPNSRAPGTKITSTKPITVTVKDDMIDYDNTWGGADLAADQLISLDNTGKKHIAVRSALTLNDKAFILATEDNTDIFVNGEVTPAATLNAGEQYVYDFTSDAAFIEGSKNIYVWQISGIGDQIAGALIPSLECTGSNQVGFVRTSTNTFNLNITIKAGAEGSFVLNGNPNLVPASAFQPVPGSNGEYVFARIQFNTQQIPSGTTCLLQNFSTELFHLGTTQRSNGASANFGYFSNFSYLNLGTDRQVCIGDSVILDAGPGKTGYLWSTGDTTQKITVFQPGMYHVQVFSGSDCFATDTINVGYYEPPINLGGRDTICEGSSLLLAPPGVYLYQWQDGSTGNTFLVEEAGLYWVEVTDFQGCRTRDTIIVETSPRPENPVISGPTELCEGENVQLVMSPTVQGAQYRWFGPNNTVFTGQTLNLANLTAAQSGRYYGFYIVAGCESFSDSIDILIKPSPEVYLGLNDTICGNTPVVLNPNSGEGNTYLWQDNSTDSTFTVTASGVYSVTVSNDIGCSRSDTVSITFTPVPDNPVIVGQSVVCEGGSISLTVAQQPGVTYTWSGPAGFAATGNSINIFPINESNSGNYTVVGNIGNCFSDVINTGITVNENPVVTLPADQIICSDSLITIDAGAGFFNYSWSNGANTQTITVGPGTYVITVGTIAGCTASDTIVINSAGPTALFSSNPASTALPGVNISFTDQSQPNNGQINTWSWNFGNVATSANQNPSFAFTTPGTYDVSLLVIDENGCADQTSLQYLITGEFAIPNSFTPNGDGFNDLFVIAGLEAFPNSKLSVYNRWGNVVFSTTAYQNDWAATDQPDGVYFYILELSNGDTFNGDVTIVRK